MAATMPDLRAAFGIMLDPHGDEVRRRQHGRTVQVHVRATARTNGISVGTSDAFWDMQQAAKSIACGTQAKTCFCGPGSSSSFFDDGLNHRPPAVLR